MFNRFKKYFTISFWKDKINKFRLNYYIVKATIEGVAKTMFYSEGSYVIIESNEILEMFDILYGFHLIGTDYIFISPDLEENKKDFIIYHELGHMMMGDEFNQEVGERDVILESGADQYSACMMYNEGYSKDEIIDTAESILESANKEIERSHREIDLKDPLIKELIKKNNEEWNKRISNLYDLLYVDLKDKPDRLKIKEDY